MSTRREQIAERIMARHNTDTDTGQKPDVDATRPDVDATRPDAQPDGRRSAGRDATGLNAGDGLDPHAARGKNSGSPAHEANPSNDVDIVNTSAHVNPSSKPSPKKSLKQKTAERKSQRIEKSRFPVRKNTAEDKDHVIDVNSPEGYRKAEIAQCVREGIPITVKDMVLKALDNAGGVSYLTEQAKKNPRIFLQLVSKIIPLQIQGSGEGGAIEINIMRHSPPTEEDIKRVVVEHTPPEIKLN